MSVTVRSIPGIVASIVAMNVVPAPAAAVDEWARSYEGPTVTVSPGQVDPAGAQTDGNSGASPTPTNDPPSSFTPRAGAIYEWSLQAPGPDGKRASLDDPTDLERPSSLDEGIPYAGWAACGFRDDRYKVVHDYSRRTVQWRQARTYARLYCGLFEDDLPEHAFGYRHILAGHAGDWQRKADYINRNWRDLAGWAMYHTFRTPGAVYLQPTRYCYQRRFYLYYGDTQVSTMRAIMYLGETGVRIMTAYPVNTAICNGTWIWGP